MKGYYKGMVKSVAVIMKKGTKNLLPGRLPAKPRRLASKLLPGCSIDLGRNVT